MSNALAIAAVSAVIKNLLENGLIRLGIASSLGETPAVTVLPPQVDDATGAQGSDQLNLFLYQTIPNPSWRNVGLPSRDSRGDRLTSPPLALDLHYLLTAYSKEAFHAEIMLGYALQLLHETPLLTRDAVRTALRSVTAGNAAAEKALATADLADQLEQVKLSPLEMNTEEMSRLWSAIQTPYRPTAVYQVSVMLIESRRPARAALPVRDRHLVGLPFKQSVIESVSPQVILAGERLTPLGRNLEASTMRISFGIEPTTVPMPADVTDTHLQVALPPGLRAGINTVQVIHPLDFGTNSPSEPHRGFESNVVAFMLAPRITTKPQPPLTVLQVGRGQLLTLAVEPPIGREQRVALIVGDRVFEIPARAVTEPETTTRLNFPIPATFVPGVYLLRLRVDGAESLLDVDPVLTSATFNQYVEPKLEVT